MCALTVTACIVPLGTISVGFHEGTHMDSVHGRVTYQTLKTNNTYSDFNSGELSSLEQFEVAYGSGGSIRPVRAVEMVCGSDFFCCLGRSVCVVRVIRMVCSPSFEKWASWDQVIPPFCE